MFIHQNSPGKRQTVRMQMQTGERALAPGGQSLTSEKKIHIEKRWLCTHFQSKNGGIEEND
jgi:hypothetical protein